MRAVPATEVEVAIGPHPSRPDWRVLRVAYRQTPDHAARITAALGLLLRSTSNEPVREGTQ